MQRRPNGRPLTGEVAPCYPSTGGACQLKGTHSGRLRSAGLEAAVMLREKGVSASRSLTSSPSGADPLCMVALKLPRLFRHAADALGMGPRGAMTRQACERSPVGSCSGDPYQQRRPVVRWDGSPQDGRMRFRRQQLSEGLLTPEEAAERLAVSTKTVRDWLRSGRLSGAKVGRL